MTLPPTGFATPRLGVSRDDCYFYTHMETPDGGLIPGDWDLRHCVDAHLGFSDFAGRRVLEIGPASGFLTFAMEDRGADVTAVELGGNYLGDVVPHHDLDMDAANRERAVLLDRLFNSFWFSHEQRGSRSRVYHGDARRLPDFGHDFEIGVLASIMLHSTDALGVLTGVARRVSQRIVIVEAWKPWMEDYVAPVARLVPDALNRNPHTWWEFAPKFFENALGVMGFRVTGLHRFDGLYNGTSPYPMYSLVADRHAP